MAITEKNQDGFTKIPNAVLDALVAYRIPGEEMKCLLFIIRKTWGWHKTSDAIALSQFHKATGMKRPSIIRALRRLERKKLIIVSQNANKKGKTYRFNKKFKTWIEIQKKSVGKALAKKLNKVSKKANENDKNVSQSATHKRNIIKEKKERENLALDSKKESKSGFLGSNKRQEQLRESKAELHQSEVFVNKAGEHQVDGDLYRALERIKPRGVVLDTTEQSQIS